MRDYYGRDYYSSTAMGGLGRRYGADTFREYEEEAYKPKDYVKDMQDNYQIYKNQAPYAPKDFSLQSLNATLESVVNVIAMLKRDARSPQEKDLIKRYIVTINEL